MPLFLCRSVLTMNNRLPEDRVVNTFVVNGPSSGAVGTLSNAWEGFWGEGAGVGSPGPQAFLSSYVIRDINDPDGPRLEICDLNVATGQISPPLITEPFDLSQFAPVTGVDLPNEVAAVVTFKADGVPVRRRRGRMFIGPLNVNALAPGSGGPLLAPGLAQGLVEGFQRFALRLAVAQAKVQVWSRADAECFDVTQVSADNAFDTQRRRGQDSTTRVTAPI